MCDSAKEAKENGTFREQYELSFNAHLNLVTIHPWVDGDGRTARLLMNYIQFCYHPFSDQKYLKKIEKNISFPCASVRMKKPTSLSWTLWAGQLKKSLSLEIEVLKLRRRKGLVLCFRGMRACLYINASVNFYR